MTLQYSAVGIQNESHMATDISDYWKDLERLQTSIGYAMWNCSLDLPVKLVTISEGGIGGWCLGGGEEHADATCQSVNQFVFSPNQPGEVELYPLGCNPVTFKPLSLELLIVLGGFEKCF